MTRKELEDFIIESVCMTFKGESRNFRDYFKIDFIKVDYEVENGEGKLYFIDHDDKKLVKTLNYEQAVCAWKFGIKEISALYEEAINKYNLDSIFMAEEGATNNETEEI